MCKIERGGCLILRSNSTGALEGGSLYANDMEKEDSKTFVKEIAFKAVFEFWGELDR